MKKIKLYLLLVIAILSMDAIAQTGINSPYSRYGLGRLNNENINAAYMGMGGLSIAIHDPTALNPANPASYGSMDSSSFLLRG